MRAHLRGDPHGRGVSGRGADHEAGHWLSPVPARGARSVDDQVARLSARTGASGSGLAPPWSARQMQVGLAPGLTRPPGRQPLPQRPIVRRANENPILGRTQNPPSASVPWILRHQLEWDRPKAPEPKLIRLPREYRLIHPLPDSPTPRETSSGLGVSIAKRDRTADIDSIIPSAPHPANAAHGRRRAGIRDQPQRATARQQIPRPTPLAAGGAGGLTLSTMSAASLTQSIALRSRAARELVVRPAPSRRRGTDRPDRERGLIATADFCRSNSRTRRDGRPQRRRILIEMAAAGGSRRAPAFWSARADADEPACPASARRANASRQ